VTECYVGHVTHFRNSCGGASNEVLPKPPSEEAKAEDDQEQEQLQAESAKIEVVETEPRLEPKKSSLKKKSSLGTSSGEGGERAGSGAKVEIQVRQQEEGKVGKKHRRKKNRKAGTSKS